MYGADEFGNSYSSLTAMWEAELGGVGKVKNAVGSRSKWYQTGSNYWAQQEVNYNGVLGGYGNLSNIDISYSTKFLQELRAMLPSFQTGCVLDCGAGIGRVTKQFLRHHFQTVDLVDQCQPYIDKARQLLADTNARKFYCSGLQDFVFEETYDCIWVQWVLTHLNDEDNIAFLKKAQRHLRKGGVIVVKENASEKGFFVDKGDSSVVRSTLLWKVLFQQAGLRVLKEELQTDWPEDLFEVRMYALQEME